MTCKLINVPLVPSDEGLGPKPTFDVKLCSVLTIFLFTIVWQNLVPYLNPVAYLKFFWGGGLQDV